MIFFFKASTLKIFSIPSQSSALRAKLSEISDSNAIPKVYCFIIFAMDYPVHKKGQSILN